VAEETAHLAPHGVPSNPLPRGLSSNKLQDLATENHGYGATHTSGSNLNIPQGTTYILYCILSIEIACVIRNMLII